MQQQREAERDKYVRSYTATTYRMGEARMIDAKAALGDLAGLSYLDVGCGRGEMLDYAMAQGATKAAGVEVVPALFARPDVVFAYAHDLPFEDEGYDVVTMLDVIEHLVPGDDEAACREIDRVAKQRILIAANNRPSFNTDGDDLHINRRPYDEWDSLFRQWFTGAVTMITEGRHVSRLWRIDR